MKAKPWRIAVVLGVAAVLLVAIYFEPTHCVRGWLWGESFFEGRPTSWWRCELHQYETQIQEGALLIEPAQPFQFRVYSRKLSYTQQIREWWTGLRIGPDVATPALLTGNPQAIPVLEELLADSSPKIRLFAQIGLGKDPEIGKE
jgi:hypothetical protein